MFLGFCQTKIDSVFSYMRDGYIYMFRGETFWRMSKNTTADRGYPMKISQKWKGVPDYFDEVFAAGSNWQTYFFKVRFHSLT